MDESRRSATPIAVALLVTILLPVFYILSIGPAGWLVENQYLNREAARCMYYPLIFAAERSTWINMTLQGYMELFE